MAIIQYTGLVNQIRGKLNGSVFNKARNVNTMGRKMVPTKAKTVSQNEYQSNFQYIQREWKLLSPSQKSAYSTLASNNQVRDRFGELVTLAGYNQFIKTSLLRTRCGLEPLYNPSTGTVPGVSVINRETALFSIYQVPSGRLVAEIQCVFTRIYSAWQLWLLVDISYPVTDGVTSYYGSWVAVGALYFPSTSVDETITGILPSRFPATAPGTRYFIRFRTISPTHGVVNSEWIHSVVQQT